LAVLTAVAALELNHNLMLLKDLMSPMVYESPILHYESKSKSLKIVKQSESNDTLYDALAARYSILRRLKNYLYFKTCLSLIFIMAFVVTISVVIFNYSQHIGATLVYCLLNSCQISIMSLYQVTSFNNSIKKCEQRLDLNTRLSISVLQVEINDKVLISVFATFFVNFAKLFYD
jgi:hypothetical protein